MANETSTAQTIAFEVGKTYTMRSPCDHECIWAYEVVSRTASTIRLRDREGKARTCRVSLYMGVEQCKPLGSYSMCPILGADRGI